MKINKLLFFLLAVFSLNSCVEYVDNGTKPDGPELPEEQKFTAIHSNPDEAKYVGDVFEFTAMLNSVDVTKSTKFKVNGTTIKGNSYTAVKVGSNSVIATMDNYTATFKFTVLEKDDEPVEPTGNRIEYGGNSYPVSQTQWALNLNANNQVVPVKINGIDYALWVMITGEYDSNDKAINEFLTAVYVPLKNSTTVAFPNEAPSALVDANIGGAITINGVKVFDVTNSTYTFAPTGNSPGQDVFTVPQPWTGTANYTATATGASSGNSAELFWNGNYEAFFTKLGAKSAKTVNISSLNKLSVKDIKKSKSLNQNQIKNLKIAK